VSALFVGPICRRCLLLRFAGTPGYVELSGTTAGQKMQQAMAEVGSTPLLALLMAYQPQEVPLEQQAAAAAGGGEQQQLVQQVLELPFDAAAVANSQEISWICVDSSKPVSFKRVMFFKITVRRGKTTSGDMCLCLVITSILPANARCVQQLGHRLQLRAAPCTAGLLQQAHHFACELPCTTFLCTNTSTIRQARRNQPATLICTTYLHSGAITAAIIQYALSFCLRPCKL
jgi:hypothetical protein